MQHQGFSTRLALLSNSFVNLKQTALQRILEAIFV